MTGLVMWVITARPTDHPTDYVARRWRQDADGAFHASIEGGALAVIAPEIETLRCLMRDRGLVAIDRAPDDDPVILESWL